MSENCRTGVRRAAAVGVIATAAVFSACGDATGPLSRADVVGIYTQQTVRGHPLPWADTSATDATRSQAIFIDGQLRLGADGAVVETGHYATRTDLRVRADTDRTGTWTLDPAGLPAGSPHIVRITHTIPGHMPDYAHGDVSGQPTQIYSLDYKVGDGGRSLQIASAEWGDAKWTR